MEFVKVEQTGFVQVVTIDRPKALNALSTQVLNELNDVFSNVNLDQTRCIILTGAGEKSFVAGADIDVMSEMTKEEGTKFGELGCDVFRKIETCPVPVIAAVNGFALGGGTELSLACDIRIASENAVFGQPEVGLGITPGFGGTQRLARTISVGYAKEMIYSGNTVKADEALRIGLVNRVVPLAELLDTCMKLANKIAKNAPIAVRNCKQAINDGLDVSIEESMKIENKAFGDCFESYDQREGMRAFLEKRKVEAFLNK